MIRLGRKGTIYRVCRSNRYRRRRENDDGDDCGRSAGCARSRKIDVVWGDTDRCPYSVGESGSRTTIQTGYAVIQAAEALKRQIAEKGLPTGENVLVGSASPNPTLEGKVRAAYAAHFVEVEVDTELGHVRVLKYLAVHDSGRIMNPLTARSQIKGGATDGHRYGAS